MNQLIKPEVKELIAKRNWAALRQITSRWPVAEVADLILDLPQAERVLLFRALPRQLAAEVFAYFEPQDQDALLSELTGEETRHLMANLAPDDRTSLLEELPAQVTQRLLTFLSPEDLKEARQLLGYPEESVGRLMTPDYITIRPEWNVAQAIEHVRKSGRDRETVDILYVTDPSSKLIGVVSLRQLILGNPQEIVRGIMRSPAISVSAFEDREEASRIMERYDLSVLPVIDSEGLLVGIVTGDDVFEVLQEEATEDFHKSAAVAPLGVGFLEARFGKLYKSRIGWLLGLVLVYLLSGTIMSRFEETISHVVALVFLLPLIIDCAGNAGSQSATLMVRALAMGDVETSDWTKVLLREVGVALALSVTMATAVWAIGTFQAGTGVAVVASVSLLIVVTVSCLLGAAIPFVLDRLGWDPAAASSPLVTSLADIMGVLVYFSVATRYLGI